MAVNPNLAIAINTIEINKDLVGFRVVGNIESLAVPPNTTWQCSTAWRSWIFFAELPFDAPIVRQIQ